MTLNDLAQGEAWMDPEECQAAAEIVRSLRQSFADRQIPETTFLILRVQDYLVHHTLCRRLDRSLMPDPGHSRENGNPAAPAIPDPKLAEQIGKSRDRLRRTLKELEDTVNKLAPPPPPPPSASAPPVIDANFYKELIEEIGVDLNDPEFFSDEENFYDLPLEEQIRLRPESAPKTPLGQAILARLNAAAPDHSNPSDTPAPSNPPAQAGAQSQCVADIPVCPIHVPPAQTEAQPPPVPPAQTEAHLPSVTPAQAGAHRPDLLSNTPADHSPPPSEPRASPSMLPIVNCPLSIVHWHKTQDPPRIPPAQDTP